MSTALRLAELAAVAVLASVVTAPVASAQPETVVPPDVVSLSEIDPSILLDIPYLTPHNFTGDPVDGYQAPLCLLTRPAAEALRRAQQEFVYPRVDKSQLFADGYIADSSGHSRGSTVDLTLVALPLAAGPEPAYVPGQPLVDCGAPKEQRFVDHSLDMGTGYDCFDTLAHTLDPRVQGEQLRNRLLLEEGLEEQGLVNYEKEWWHYTFEPEPYPETYFDFPVAPITAR
ncbi:D-alanyl-D-alanine dipeptidase [Mycolicibacterium litorale]|uniref:D-alanyl-D-alanine dipeptidase n=1 Tax=Mycolicibacterium litorale TaxID=758802 RepID=A0A6S6PAN2_9MYCO|nr:M15 family metallopeptidase [Mycolicibacterium litorale]BCI54771.1 D-alanyl-D-alanine dipeptidase [Mycolicibacterium litorale]